MASPKQPLISLTRATWSRLRASAPRAWRRLGTAGLVIVQGILILILFGQLNYLSCRRHNTWDLTSNRRFTLSETTQSYLNSLSGIGGSEVRLVMAFLGTSELQPDVKGLLSEYDRLGGDAVAAEYLDLSRSRERLSELKDKYQVQFSRDQILIIGASGRLKTIGAEELVIRDANSGQIAAFRGEEVITAALLEVTEQQQRKIYFITGDRRADDLLGIAAQLAPLANAQNARLESLVLEGINEIPADADALFFPGNSSDLTERELGLVQKFWEERQGGLVIYLDPAADTPNLDAFLRVHGIAPGKDRVLTVVNIPGVASRRTYEVPVTLLPGDGPTREFPALTTRLSGITRSLTVQEDDDLLLSENIRTKALMAAADGFWGERDFEAAEVSYNPDLDTGPPDLVYTAASVERGRPGDANLVEGAARLVVAGNPNLIAPDGNTSKVAADFTLASLNWVMSRDALIGISPRNPTAFTLNISAADFGILQSIMIFGLPGLCIIVAGFVWMRRRA
jgi:ABC-type uncharacterized transport system